MNPHHLHLNRFYQALLTRIFGPLEIEYDSKASTTFDLAHLPVDTKPINVHTPPGQMLPAQQDIPASRHNPITTNNIYLDSTRFG